MIGPSRVRSVFAAVFVAACSTSLVSPTLGLVVSALAAGVFVLLILLIAGQRPSLAVSTHTAAPQSTESKQEVSSLSIKVLAIAIGLRLVITAVVNATPLWASFGPDALAWSAWGRMLSANWWKGLNGTLQTPVNPHVISNAISHQLFGVSRIPVSFFNSILGILLSLIIFYLGRTLYNDRIARRAFLLTLFFPSLMLWQSQNLKDVWAQVATAGLALAVARFPRTRTPGFIIIGLICFYIATWTRPYLAVILLAAVMISVTAVSIRRLPATIIVVLGSAVGGKVAGLDQKLSTETLVTIDQARKGLSYGGSAYGADADTTTIWGALSYFPEGMVRFLFAPFPWEIDSWLQALAFPESILFLFFSAQALRHVIMGQVPLGRKMVPIAFFATIASSYALASGNEGTAFRHRAQITPFVLLMASAYQKRPIRR
ncbi:MAG: glycosyltransferase family 39 protein [Myxococcota bacterium]